MPASQQHEHQQSSYYPAWPPPVAVPLVTVPEEPCSYLPGQHSRIRAMIIERMSPEMYLMFMDAGFRRSGKLIYQPVCRGCRQCLPIRTLVKTFRPDKSMRRCWRRNADLDVAIVSPPVPSDEKHALYQRYIRQWHGRVGPGDESREAFDAFLYCSPVQTIEFTYREPKTSRLIAVGICDVSATAISSVYCYFDPADARRGLGTYAALRELDHAKSSGMLYYYLGYWVYGCTSMNYKAHFIPNEVLYTDGQWHTGRFAPVEPARPELVEIAIKGNAGIVTSTRGG